MSMKHHSLTIVDLFVEIFVCLCCGVKGVDNTLAPNVRAVEGSAVSSRLD
jgi:hypothetical protein